MNIEKYTEHIVFHEPFLRMSYPKRLAIRIITRIWLAIHLAATVAMLLSDVRYLFWIGILNMLYFTDRFLHFLYGETILRAPDKDGVVLSPRARRAIDAALDGAALEGGDALLLVAKHLIGMRAVRVMFNHLNAGADEFSAKLHEHILRKAHPRGVRIYSAKDIEALLEHAARVAVEISGRKRAGVRDLFVALGHMDADPPSSLFRLFGISPDDLLRAHRIMRNGKNKG